MVFAQVQDGIVTNTIILNDYSLLPLFQKDQLGNLYDYVLQVDATYPQPGVGWAFDGIQFTPPPPSVDTGDGDGLL